MKGLIFDMDGTMFDTEIISLEAMAHTARNYGISLERSVMLSFLGLPSEEIRRRFLAIYGEDFDYAGYRLEKIRYQDRVIEEKGVPLKTGLLPLLEYAKSKHLPCAVATSTSRHRAENLIAKAGLTNYFAAIVCGEDVSCGKPSPDIFLLAAQKLSLSPADCLGIEDSQNGILSAHQAGMKTALIPDLIPVNEEMRQSADWIFTDLFGVLDLLSK